MALEDLTGDKYIDSLDSANPVGTTDFVASVDDHMRGVKNVLKKTFPNVDNEIGLTVAEFMLLSGQGGTLINSLGGQTINGDLDITGQLNLEAGYTEDVNVTITGGAISLDLQLATYFYTPVLTSIPTFSFINPAVTGNLSSLTLELNNAGSYAPAWPGGIIWSGGNEPLWSAGKDLVTFLTRDGGTTWIALLSGLNIS